jgi:hypothetical protein
MNIKSINSSGIGNNKPQLEKISSSELKSFGGGLTNKGKLVIGDRKRTSS